MGCSRYGMERWQTKMNRMQEKMDRVRERAQGRPALAEASGRRRRPATRRSTIIAPKRCAGSKMSSAEFQDFLARLREAKDKRRVRPVQWPIAAAVAAIPPPPASAGHSRELWRISVLPAPPATAALRRKAVFCCRAG